MRTAFAAAQIVLGIFMLRAVNGIISGEAHCIEPDEIALAAWIGLGMAGIMFGTAAVLLFARRG